MTSPTLNEGLSVAGMTEIKHVTHILNFKHWWSRELSSPHHLQSDVCETVELMSSDGPPKPGEIQDDSRQPVMVHDIFQPLPSRQCGYILCFQLKSPRC